MAEKIVIPAIESTVVTSKVTYKDGIVINVVGSNNETTRKPLYLAEKSKQVVIPPVSDIKIVKVANNNELDLTSLKGVILIPKGYYEGVKIVGSLSDATIDFSGSTFSKGSSIYLGKGNNVKITNLVLDNPAPRAIQFDFALNNLELNNISFIGGSDYAISSPNYDKNTNTGLKIINCSFDNAGQINLGAYITTNNDLSFGLFKDVEIAGCTFKNGNLGDAVIISNAMNYNVHDNKVDNYNATNNNHNGIFHLQGNGKFYNNKLTNYQGNALRAWLFSRDGNGIEIYNNTLFNTRKYGGFEVQEFKGTFINGISSANAKVYNNTVGQMNTSKAWQGQILDVYQISGTLEYKNNLGFNLYSDNSWQPVTDGRNQISTDVKTVSEGNVYKPNWQDTVIDLTSFKSKFTGVGSN